MLGVSPIEHKGTDFLVQICTFLGVSIDHNGTYFQIDWGVALIHIFLGISLTAHNGTYFRISMEGGSDQSGVTSGDDITLPSQ